MNMKTKFEEKLLKDMWTSTSDATRRAVYAAITFPHPLNIKRKEEEKKKNDNEIK